MNADTWAVVVATIVGPLAAVLITMHLQRRAQRYDRRLEIFRAMMRSRRAMITPEWVGALNLVQVEFADKKDVIDAFTRLLDRYNDPSWQGTPAQRNAAENNMEVAAAELLQKIAFVVNINLRGADLRRAYLPSGWNSDEQELRRVRLGIVEWLSGERAVSVQISEPQPPQPVVDPPTPGSSA